jgi:hypothetical protein
MDMATVFFCGAGHRSSVRHPHQSASINAGTPGDALSKLAHQVQTAKQTDWYNRELYRTEQRLTGLTDVSNWTTRFANSNVRGAVELPMLACSRSRTGSMDASRRLGSAEESEALGLQPHALRGARWTTARWTGLIHELVQFKDDTCR